MERGECSQLRQEGKKATDFHWWLPWKLSPYSVEGEGGWVLETPSRREFQEVECVNSPSWCCILCVHSTEEGYLG